MSCASDKSQKGIIQESEYKKILDRQRQKDSFAFDQDAKAKKIPEMTADGHERLGDSYLKQGNIDLAFVQYNEALTLDPNLISVRYKIGCLFLKKGLSKDAEEQYNKICGQA